MRQRVDWVTFFRQCPKPHGVRLRLLNVGSTFPKALLAEKRLISILKEMSRDEPFAVRRSFNEGPSIVDAVFASQPFADRVASAIGATPVKAPLGWTSARELVADEERLARLIKLGAVRPEAAAGALSVAPVGLAAAVLPTPGTSRVDQALNRLAAMSAEQQAAALYEMLTNGAVTRARTWSQAADEG